MKKAQLVKTTPAPRLTMPAWWWLPFLLGVLTAAAALLQLADFEEFVLALDDYGLTEGSTTVTLAIAIAAMEILSLPVLFRLSLSRLMRVLSAAAVLLLPLKWLGISFMVVAGGLHPKNAGFFGGVLPQPLGWGSILILFVILMIALFTLHILGGRKLVA